MRARRCAISMADEGARGIVVADFNDDARVDVVTAEIVDLLHVLLQD